MESWNHGLRGMKTIESWNTGLEEFRRLKNDLIPLLLPIIPLFQDSIIAGVSQNKRSQKHL
jgi:hypothetical protein